MTTASGLQMCGLTDLRYLLKDIKSRALSPEEEHRFPIAPDDHEAHPADEDWARSASPYTLRRDLLVLAQVLKAWDYVVDALVMKRRSADLLAAINWHGLISSPSLCKL